MRKEWILTDEEKYLKREKIVRNRLIKQQQARNILEHPPTDFIPIHEVRSNSSLSYLRFPFLSNHRLLLLLLLLRRLRLLNSNNLGAIIPFK